MVRAGRGFVSTRRSSRERPEPKAPGSTSKPRWQANLLQEARLSQCDRSRFCQLQLSLGAPRFAVVCFSQNWAMSGSLAQLSVATAQGQTQLVLQLVKVGKFPLYVGELFFQSAAHRCTRLQAVSSQIQETANLTEFESQALHAADKSECLHVALSVSTESTLRSWRSREQCIAFVEPNRVNAETNLLRDDADLHYLGSSVEATPWSIVQSQHLSGDGLCAADDGHQLSRLRPIRTSAVLLAVQKSACGEFHRFTGSVTINAHLDSA